MMNVEFGFGGMLTIDAGSLEKANESNGINAAEKLGLLSSKFRVL